MFLVEKSYISSNFRSITKKSSSVPKSYQLAARLFDEKVSLHLKNLVTDSNSLNFSLSWMSAAVSFLSTVHKEAQDQISNLRYESDDYQALYMDYSLKVLDLCNLISSAVQQLTERRLLVNLSLRLLKFSDQIPSPDKLNKAKDALTRSVNGTQDSAKEKSLRAEALIVELAGALGSLPRLKASSQRDLIRRTFYALGLLTVFVGNILVSVLYGKSDLVNIRVPAEFLWADMVNGVQTQIFDLISQKQTQREASEEGERKGRLLEIEDMLSKAVAVRDVLDGDVINDRVRLENCVGELGTAAKKFSEGVDELTNGVNGLFSTVLKTRNGVLDSVRMGPSKV